MLLRYSFIFIFLFVMGCKASFEVGGLSFNPLNGTIGLTGIKISPKNKIATFDVDGQGETVNDAIKNCYANFEKEYTVVADSLMDIRLIKIEKVFDFSKIKLFRYNYIIKAKAIRYVEIFD